MEKLKSNAQLDLRGVPCPTNFVKAKLEIEELNDQEVLELIVDEDEALKNVPASMKAEGHRVLQVEQDDNGVFKLLIRKGG